MGNTAQTNFFISGKFNVVLSTKSVSTSIEVLQTIVASADAKVQFTLPSKCFSYSNYPL